MSSPENMGRRRFIEGLAGAGVAGAMVGAPKAEAQATERERRESISPEAYKLMEEWGVTFTGSEISAPSDFVEYYPAKTAPERERFPGVCLTADARAVKVWTLTKTDQAGSPTYLMFDITNKDGKTDSVTLFKYQSGPDKGTHYFPLEKKTYEITSFKKGRCSSSAFTS